MWNILIVIIIVIIIWALNPLGHFSPKQDIENQQTTINQINQVENQTIEQVNRARKMQKQEDEQLNN